MHSPEKKNAIIFKNLQFYSKILAEAPRSLLRILSKLHVQ